MEYNRNLCDIAPTLSFTRNISKYYKKPGRRLLRRLSVNGQLLCFYHILVKNMSLCTKRRGLVKEDVNENT